MPYLGHIYTKKNLHYLSDIPSSIGVLCYLWGPYSGVIHSFIHSTPSRCLALASGSEQALESLGLPMTLKGPCPMPGGKLPEGGPIPCTSLFPSRVQLCSFLSGPVLANSLPKEASLRTYHVIFNSCACSLHPEDLLHQGATWRPDSMFPKVQDFPDSSQPHTFPVSPGPVSDGNTCEHLEGLCLFVYNAVDHQTKPPAYKIHFGSYIRTTPS